MKLAVIFNAWADGLDLLQYSIENKLPLCDGIIVVWSNKSNYGQIDDRMEAFTRKECHPKVTFYRCEPQIGIRPHDNERNRRNFGLNIAREQGYTHFLMADCDEFYDRDEFLQDKQYLEQKNLKGMVCHTRVYFKKPTLSVPDHTLVPFIHKITPQLKFINFADYPFAYIDGHAMIDPTRRLNIKDGIEMASITMHHYSWVRSDYNLKIENSSASANIKRSTIWKDLEHAEDGYYCEFYRNKLVNCPNYFGLPDYD